VRAVAAAGGASSGGAAPAADLHLGRPMAAITTAPVPGRPARIADTTENAAALGPGGGWWIGGVSVWKLAGSSRFAP